MAVAFDFGARATNLRCVLVKPGKFYVPGTGWQDPPADKKFTADHKITPTRFFDSGDAMDCWRIVIPADPDDLVDSALLVFNSDGIGTLGDRIGFYPVHFANPQQVWAESGRFSVYRA